MTERKLGDDAVTDAKLADEGVSSTRSLDHSPVTDDVAHERAETCWTSPRSGRTQCDAGGIDLGLGGPCAGTTCWSRSRTA